MKKFLLGLVLLLSPACPLFGQATNGFHRTAIALARAFQGVTAQVVPNAKVTVTATATGNAAVIYSDPALSSQIIPPVVTTDNSGNYGYYIPLGYCVTETITAPGQGTQVIPNVCNNNSGAGTSFQTNSVNNSSQTNLNFTDTATVKFTNPGGGTESASVPDATNNSKGAVQCDGTTTTCSGGIISALPSSSGITSVNSQTGPAITIKGDPGVSVNTPSSNVVQLHSATGSSASQCGLGLTGLVGALTDSGGVIKQTPLCIGNGSISFLVGPNSTQLQLGINDNKYADNTGSFVVNVSKNGGAASPVTVGGTAMPWSSTTNTAYAYGQNDGTSPVVALTGLIAGDVITVTYSSGTVLCGISTPQCPSTDANGWLTTPPGPSAYGGPTGTFSGPTYGTYPTYFMSVSGTTQNALTAQATGGAAPGTTFDGSTARIFDYHSFGAQQALTLTTTGTSGPATLSSGTLNIPQYTGGSGTFGPNTWVYAAGVNGGTCNHTADETTAFNALLSTVSTAGGGTISYQCNGLFNSAEITVPVNIRITGLIASANGQWSTPPSTTTSRMDLQFNATDAKLVWINVGKGEIDHMNIVDTSTDTAPFILTINTTLAIHDNLFSGTASGTLAVNDAIILGGTTTTIGNAVTDAFQGYGTYIQHNFFDKIRRAAYYRVFAQAITFKDNTISKTCGSTNTAAAVQTVVPVGSSDGNIFGGNLFETSNYPYVYWFASDNNLVFGDTFWDATATTLFAFHFTGSAQNNVAYVSVDATVTYAKLTDNNQPQGPNTVLSEGLQSALGLAALQNRYCPDTSGSGTAQSCSTNDGSGFTPTVGTLILYHTTTSNSGTGLTINVNGLGAKSVRVSSASGWTATLSTSPASVPGGAGTVPLIPMVYDGTNWNVIQNGVTAPLSLTTTGTSGAATLSGGVLNVPQYQGALTLTTTGTSGAATLVGTTLNIPQYTGSGGSGAWVNITGSSQVTATGCTQSASTGGICSIVGSTTTAVTFSVIPGTYTGLRVVIYGGSTAGSTNNILYTFNSDTGSNYARSGYNQSNVSAPTSAGQLSQTSCVAGAVANTGSMQSIMEIPFYANTAFIKTAVSTANTVASVSSGTNNAQNVLGCGWNSTAAITSITFTISANDYAAGTEFVLYGIN